MLSKTFLLSFIYFLLSGDIVLKPLFGHPVNDDIQKNSRNIKKRFYLIINVLKALQTVNDTA